jgi:hypothetical protein
VFHPMEGKRVSGRRGVLMNRLARPLTLDGVLPKTNGVVMRVTVIFELEQPRKGGCDAKLP